MSLKQFQWTALYKKTANHGLTRQQRIRLMLVTGMIDGHLHVGMRLPSSRDMAKYLSVSRNTVMLAYRGLEDEEYLQARERSGYFIAQNNALKNADELHKIAGNKANNTYLQANDKTPGAVQDWSSRLTFHPSSQRNIVKPTNWQSLPYPFIYGQFDVNLFPRAQWRECCTRALSVMDISNWAPDLINRDDEELIEAIRRHVLPSRGIWAQADEIVITVGAQHGLYMLASLLMQAHTIVGMENPGYPDARNVFNYRTANVIPLEIDQYGLCLNDNLEQCDYIFVTPGHQCPTNVSLDMDRRHSLLELASQHDIILIEDDYETENRYDKHHLPSLKSLDTQNRVLYLGSLSKSFAPGLRLGYIVAPPALASELRALRRLMLRHPPAYVQRAFALFISLGHYHALLRRQTRVYEQRAKILQNSVRKFLPMFNGHELIGGSSWWLQGPDSLDTSDLAQKALKAGIVIEPGAVFWHNAQAAQKNTIRLGFSAIDTNRIETGIYQLSELIKHNYP